MQKITNYLDWPLEDISILFQYEEFLCDSTKFAYFVDYFWSTISHGGVHFYEE